MTVEMTSGGKQAGPNSCARRSDGEALSSKTIFQLCFLKVLSEESHDVSNIWTNQRADHPACVKGSFNTRTFPVKTLGDGSTLSAVEQC